MLQAISRNKALTFFALMAVALFGMSFFGFAGATAATDIAAMSGDAEAGTNAVKTGVLSIIGVVLIIALLIWGSKKLRPHG